MGRLLLLFTVCNILIFTVASAKVNRNQKINKPSGEQRKKGSGHGPGPGHGHGPGPGNGHGPGNDFWGGNSGDIWGGNWGDFLGGNEVDIWGGSWDDFLGGDGNDFGGGNWGDIWGGNGGDIWGGDGDDFWGGNVGGNGDDFWGGNGDDFWGGNGWGSGGGNGFFGGNGHTPFGPPPRPKPPKPTTKPPPKPSIHHMCEDTLDCCSHNDTDAFLECSGHLGCIPSCDGYLPTTILISDYCIDNGECCSYPKYSLDYFLCAQYYGCCSTCDHSHKKCGSSTNCEADGGKCRKKCESDEHSISVSCGKKCKCCVKDEPVDPLIDICITGSEAQEECCQYEIGSEDFNFCRDTHGCFPICDTNGCSYNGMIYQTGEEVDRFPEKCMTLRCVEQTITIPPYVTHSVVTSMEKEGCDCCTLEGQMYANGDLLSDHNNCYGIQCVDGSWEYQGYINNECSACQYRYSPNLIATLDGTVLSGGDPDTCTYSLIQDGNGLTPNQYAFANSETVYFKEDGSDEISCIQADHMNSCSTGPTPSSPTEIGDTGVLTFAVDLAGNRTIFTGTNGIAMMIHEDTIFILAHSSVQDQVGGLCGTFNDDTSDDKTTRDDVLTTDNEEFINSWETTSGQCPAVRRSDVKKRAMDMCEDCTDCGDFNVMKRMSEEYYNITMVGDFNETMTCSYMLHFFYYMYPIDQPSSLVIQYLQKMCHDIACQCMMNGEFNDVFDALMECTDPLITLVGDRLLVYDRMRSPSDIYFFVNGVPHGNFF